LRHQDGVASAEYSPDGRLLVTACLDGTARLWVAESGEPFHPNPVLRHPGRVMHAAFSPDGHQVATACYDGTARVWDLAGATVIPTRVDAMLSDEGRHLLSRSNEVIRVLSVESAAGAGADLTVGPGLARTRLSRDGKFLLAVSTNPGPRAAASVWSVAGARRLGPELPLEAGWSEVQLSDDGRHLAVSREAALRVYDVAGAVESFTVPLGKAAGETRFSPAGRWVAVASGDTVEVWDLGERRRRFPPLPHPDLVRCLRFSPDNRWLATGCADRQMTECAARIWEVATGRLAGVPMQHRDGIVAVAFSPNGRRVATASEDFTARVWETATGQPRTPPLRHRHQVHMLSFSADGRWLATASSEPSARIWDAETGDPITPPFRASPALESAHFDAAGGRLIACSPPDGAWIWDLSREATPIEDRLLLSQVLTGFRNTPAGYPVPASTRAQVAVWERLKSIHPRGFAVSEDQHLTWHGDQAWRSQADGDWAAVVFHLEQVLRLTPTDSTTRGRLEDARQHLPLGVVR
jgi:WD40 repeat protein